MNLKNKEKLFSHLARNYDSMDYPPILLYGKVGRQRIRQAWRRRAAQIRKGAADYPALYVHVPYCQTKCFFCKFRVRVANSPRLTGQYLKCLKGEIEELSPIFKKVGFKTMYLAGGTPTILSEPQLEELLGLLEKKFDLSATYQRLIEATPATLSPGKLKILKKHGINRLTIGVQSLDNGLLARMNRKNQNREMVSRVYAQARKTGIEHINIDLVVGIPGQSKESFLSDVDYVLGMRPDALHIFAYEEEELVIFYKMGKRINDADRARRDEMFALADRKIIKSGYRTYKGESYILSMPAANYQFLLRYHANGSLLGLGAKALSYIPGHYAYQNAQVEEYLAYRSQGKIPPYVDAYPLDRAETSINYVVNNIRGGLDKNAFNKLYGRNFDTQFKGAVNCLKKLGRIEEKAGTVRLAAKSDLEFRTYSKFFFSPAVIGKLKKSLKYRSGDEI
jgi:oxygen-independent coproporphyrinogen-3 oxidase